MTQATRNKTRYFQKPLSQSYRLNIIGVILLSSFYCFSDVQAATYPTSEIDLINEQPFFASPLEKIFEIDGVLMGSEYGPGTYKYDFISAIDLFQNNRTKEALKLAQKLHNRFPEKVDPINLIAAAYLRLAQWDKAKIELEKVLKISQNNPTALRNLAKVELNTGNPQRAKYILDQLNKIQPNDDETQKLTLVAESKIKSGKENIEALKKMVNTAPNDLNARTKLANLYFINSNFEKVIELTYNLSDKDLVNKTELLALKGKAQMLKGDANAAIKTLEKWTQQKPNSAESHFYFAEALTRTGNNNDAKIELEKAININPQFLLARISLIKIWVHLGQIESAKKELTKLKNDFGARPGILGIEGSLALALGDFPTAEKQLTITWKQSPNSKTTRLLTQALWGQKKHEQALSLMQEWLKTNPQDTAVLLQLAGAYLDIDQEKNAIATYEQAIEITPDSLPILNNLAWLNRDINLTLALDYAKRAIKISPQDPYVLDTLGMLTLKKGDIKRAFELVKAATEHLPTEPTFQVHLSRIFIQQQKKKDAKKILDKIVADAPKSEAGKQAQEILKSIAITNTN